MKFDLFNPNKLLAHYRTMVDIIEGWKTLPVTVSIDPSSKCNQFCTYCSGKGYVNTHGEMLSRELLTRLPEELAGLGIGAVYFTGGGEPLCNPHMASTIDEFLTYGIGIGLITNGMALVGDLPDVLGAHAKFVRISIDAGSPETYERLHGVKKSTFGMVMRHIKAMVNSKKEYKSDCEIGLSFLIHPRNYMEIREFYTVAQILGVDYVQYKPVTMGRWLTDEISSTIVRNLEICRGEANGSKTRVIANFGRMRHENKKYVRLYDTCLGHNLIGVIMATGQLNVCCQHRPQKQFAFGDLYTQSFEDIWNSKERKEAVECIDVHKCPTCKYENYNQMLWTMKNPTPHSSFL